MLSYKWLPDRKVWAGGVLGILTWAIGTWLVDIPEDTAAMVAALVWSLVSYFLPPPLKETLLRADEAMKDAAKEAPGDEDAL